MQAASRLAREQDDAAPRPAPYVPLSCLQSQQQPLNLGLDLLCRSEVGKWRRSVVCLINYICLMRTHMYLEKRNAGGSKKWAASGTTTMMTAAMRFLSTVSCIVCLQ